MRNIAANQVPPLATRETQVIFGCKASGRILFLHQLQLRSARDAMQIPLSRRVVECFLADVAGTAGCATVAGKVTDLAG